MAIQLPARRARTGADSASTLSIEARVREVANALGSSANLAALLDISPSQPTRWLQGREQPSPASARAIVDLDHVIARANLLWQPSVVTSWLYGNNAFLEGARPVDVVKLQGATPVIAALDQELAGGYA